MSEKKKASSRPRRKGHRDHSVIFDVMYGFIPITDWEAQIIDSPFYQRLRWVKQLGFSNYIFPGAEHNRFAHAIGVMHSMQTMVEALDVAVPKAQLFDPKATDEASMLHKCLRIAALLHDIGTFPFSHAVEYAYVRHGIDSRRDRQVKDLPNTHEHLGSFIIKNTMYDGGITQILDHFDLDRQLISDIIKGDSKYPIANQLMHSDLDADRMDYLLRDSHYTGIKYGQFDRDYILANLTTFDLPNGQIAFGVRENAIHAVEDYLIARFSWYSQIIKNPGSAKFDVMASHISTAYLNQDLMNQFQDLLTMVEEGDERFYWWNDIYFMNRMQEVKLKHLAKDSKTAELTDMLLYRRPPKTIHEPLFQHRYIQSHGGDHEREKLVKRIRARTDEFQATIDKHGSGKEWILVDIPDKDVVFTDKYDSVVEKRSSENIYFERDPVKLVNYEGEPSLLVEKDNSLMKRLSGITNFVPSVYANEQAAKLLRSKGVI